MEDKHSRIIAISMAVGTGPGSLALACKTKVQTAQGYPRAGSQTYPSAAAVPNADGSTTVYFGPTLPAGVQPVNWVQTGSGKGWNTILRLYSPLEPFFLKTKSDHPAQRSRGHAIIPKSNPPRPKAHGIGHSEPRRCSCRRNRACQLPMAGSRWQNCLGVSNSAPGLLAAPLASAR
jgi:hypothetical protein